MKRLILLNYFCLLFFSAKLQSQCISDWENKNLSTLGTSFNAVASNESNNYFIVGNNSIILKSSDNFKSFINVKIDNVFKNTNFNDIIFVNNNEGIIVGDCGLILKSNDKGNSWFKVNTNFNENILSCDYKNDILIVVGTNGIIYFSENKGDNWIKANNSDQFDLRKVKILDTMNVIAVGDKGLVYRSQNYGKDWVRLYKPTEGRILFDIDIINDKIVVSGNLGTILVSYDNGLKWQLFNKGQEPLDFFGEKADIKGIKYLDENNLIAWGWFDGFYYTNNGGIDWVIHDNSDTTRIVEFNRIIKTNELLYGFGNVSELKSSAILTSIDNGKKWSFLKIESNVGEFDRSNLNVNIEDFNALDLNESGICVVGSNNGNIYYKDAFDITSKLTKVLNIGSTIKDIAIINNSNLLALSADSGKCYLGTGFGAKIEEIKPLGYTSKFLNNEQIIYNFPNTFLSMSYYPLDINFPESILLFSSNYGVNWEKVNVNLDLPYYIKNISKFGTENILHLKVIIDTITIKTESKIFQITKENQLIEIKWETDNEDTKFIEDLHFFNKDNGFMLIKVLNNFKLYYSNDSGKNWELTNIDLSKEIPYDNFKIYYLDSLNLLTIANINNEYSKLYYSKNGGINWVEDTLYLSTGNTELITDCVGFNRNNLNNYLTIGNKKTTFQKSFININNSINNKEILNNYKSFPNPSSEKISLDLGDIEIADLVIYDILSNEIMSIPNYINKSEIDISNLYKGTYLIKIQHGNNTKAVKVVVN